MPPNRPSSGWIIDPDLDEIDLDPSDFTSSLPLKKVPNGDVFQASRAGDVERLKYLLESGVNVNARDQWDSVALYYACLAGHLDAARMLLESGAICSEHTFDGDRCHYAALNLKVRKLLKAFEARPPPLAPLQAALRDTFLSCEANKVYLEQSEAVYHVSGWCLNFIFSLFILKITVFVHRLVNLSSNFLYSNCLSHFGWKWKWRGTSCSIPFHMQCCFVCY